MSVTTMTATRTFKDWLGDFFVPSIENSTDFIYLSNLKSMYEEDQLSYTKEVAATQKPPEPDYLKEIKESGFKFQTVNNGTVKIFIKRKTQAKDASLHPTKGT